MPTRDGSHWTRYNQRQNHRAARPLLVEGMKHACPTGVAVDLGCGAGVETRLLLATGWTVYALDGDHQSLARLANTVEMGERPRLTTWTVDLDDLPSLPEADLIYSGYSLPFTNPRRFRATWGTLTQALKPGSVVAVNLFGDRDSWATEDKEATFLSEAETRSLFVGLDIIHFEVEDEDGLAFSGPKHWHVFDVIARRPHERSASSSLSLSR